MSQDLHVPTPDVDGLDLRLLQVLAGDARQSNSALAEAVGIAASTCHSRVAALRRRGVIRAFRIDLDSASLGRPIEAMIAVRLGVHSRAQIDDFVAVVSQLPGVLSLFHVSGMNDYLVQVAMPSPQALSNFVLDHLAIHPAVRHAETSLIFNHIPCRGLLRDEAGAGS